MIAQHRPDCARGFTLVEMAIVILIAGLIIFAVMAVFRPLVASFQFMETTKKMEKVSRILNAYAVLNYRLPCPAVPDTGTANPPYGFEAGSGAAGADIPDSCPQTEGVIPFRTLGVPEGLAVDGYGNHFTYAISPAFSQNTLNNLPATVHPACRTGDWLYDEGKDSSGVRIPQSINSRKARFCCPGTPAAATDLNILDENGNFVLALVRNPGPDGNAAPEVLMRPVLGGVALAPGHASYFDVPQVPPANARATAPAYIVISHGQNGLGAYVPAANARNAAPASAQELENADGDNTYQDTKTRSTNAAMRFDDLVLWRTQDMIFAEEGQSCSLP